MADPKMDDWEEVDDWVDTAPTTSSGQPIAPDGPVLRAPERSAWNTLRSIGEATNLIPVGVIPDEGALRGAAASSAQGPVLNWADETAGLLAARQAGVASMLEGDTPSERKDLDALARSYVAQGVRPDDARQMARERIFGLGGSKYIEGRNAYRDIEGAFRTENPAAAFALQTATGMLAPVPRSSASPSFITRYMAAMAPGAVSGAGAAAESEDMAQAAAVGAPLAAAGQSFGEVVGDTLGLAFGAASRAAGSKVAEAETKAQQIAAEKVAAELASAKGKLGATTQEANRALENLLRLESTGGLSGEQANILATLRQNGTLPALQSKLADAMLEQVPGAAGRVDIARSAFEGLSERAPEATAEAAEAILSGSEAKRQVGERVKRYLPTVMGSIYGAGAGAGASVAMGGGPGEALIGALAGAGIRPALRAGQRMLAHPAVQRAMYEPIERGAAAVANSSMAGLSSLGAAATYAWRNDVESPTRSDTSTSDLVRALAESDPEALGSYAQQLQQAAAVGNLPLVHYTLQQKDPQYRALLEQVRRGGTQ